MAITKAISLVIFGAYFVSVSCNSSSNGSNVNSNNTGNGELIFAHVVFRHGDRNIFYGYPNSPFKNSSLWPGGPGALTKLGKKDQYRLGKYLRARYQNLIGSGYSPNQVYVRSTDEDRNLMSTECTMAGLFAPTQDEIWNEELDWQPIPIHSVPGDDDYLINSFVECPRFDYLFEKRLNSIAHKLLMFKHRALLKFIEKKSGRKIEKVTDVWGLYSDLMIENRRNFTTEWNRFAMKSSDILEYISAVSYESSTYYTEMKKQRAGFLFKEMLDRFTNKTKSLLNPDRTLWIYAIHSTGMVNVLNSLGVFDFLIPPFSSSILFELYKRSDEYYVQVIYRKTVSDDAEPLNIPKCGRMCPLTRFYEVYKNILPTENETFESLCRLSQ